MRMLRSPAIAALTLRPQLLLAQLQTGMPDSTEPLPHPEIPVPLEVSAHYPWWVYLSGGTLFAAVIVLLVWLLVGGKKLPSAPPKRPLQAALRALKTLHGRVDLMGPSEIGHAVSEILRKYYQDRYHIPAPFRTTEELFPPVRLEDEPLRRRHWRERFETLASLYDSLSYAPLPATKSEAVMLVETAINKVEEERLNENSVAE